MAVCAIGWDMWCYLKRGRLLPVTITGDRAIPNTTFHRTTLRAGRAVITAASAVTLIGVAPVAKVKAQQTADWAALARYREANAKVPPPAAGEQRVVFMGNSITSGWAPFFDAQFPGKPYYGRGISGQTTPQMLLRFHQDVIALKPSVVVILAGTNDIAGNTGESTLEMIEDNIEAMNELARAHGIRVVLCSVLPVSDYPWKKGLEPGPKIVALNAWIRAYAKSHGAVYADFHSAMVNAELGLPKTLAADGVHPNEAGYKVMARIVSDAIAAALK